jgi:hypothetical protein
MYFMVPLSKEIYPGLLFSCESSFALATVVWQTDVATTFCVRKKLAYEPNTGAPCSCLGAATTDYSEVQPIPKGFGPHVRATHKRALSRLSSETSACSLSMCWPAVRNALWIFAM